MSNVIYVVYSTESNVYWQWYVGVSVSGGVDRGGHGGQKTRVKLNSYFELYRQGLATVRKCLTNWLENHQGI